MHRPGKGLCPQARAEAPRRLDCRLDNMYNIASLDAWFERVRDRDQLVIDVTHLSLSSLLQASPAFTT